MARLGTICSDTIETLKPSYRGYIDYIDISSVDNKLKRIVSTQRILANEAPSRAKQIVQKGDILVSTVRPNLNAVAIVDEDYDMPVASTGYCVLRCVDSIDKRYVFHYCQSQRFVDTLSAQATGASYPAVSNSIVKSTEIPLPTLHQQTLVSQAFDQIDNLISLRKKQLQKLDDLVKSRFVEMFGNPFDPHGSVRWPIKTVGDIAESISDGSNVDKTLYKESGEVLFLRIQNVWCNEFRLEDSVYISEADNEEYKDTALKHGDLLITKIGRYYTSDSSLGRVSIYLGEDNKANYSNNIMRIRFSDEINSEFVNALMNLDDYNKYIRRTSVGGTDKRALSKGLISMYPIVVPPINEQNDFVNYIHQIDKTKLIVQKGLDKLELMKQSLMQKYF